MYVDERRTKPRNDGKGYIVETADDYERCTLKNLGGSIFAPTSLKQRSAVLSVMLNLEFSTKNLNWISWRSSYRSSTLVRRYRKSSGLVYIYSCRCQQNLTLILLLYPRLGWFSSIEGHRHLDRPSTFYIQQRSKNIREVSICLGILHHWNRL